MPLVLTAALLSACAVGQASDQSHQLEPIPSVSLNPAIAAMIPEHVRQDGILTFAIDPNYAPMEILVGNQLKGVDVELAQAISQVVGLTPEFDLTSFSNVVPSVAINQYELGISALWADNSAAALVDMVTYMQAGTAMAVHLDDSAPKNSKSGLCGFRVSVEEGTEFIDTMVANSEKCVAQGKTGITIVATNTQDQATALLVEDKVDAMIADSTVVEYVVAQAAGRLAVVGKPVAVRPYGIAVNPNHHDFSMAIAAAIQYLIDTGVYQQILSKWHVSTDGIAKSEVLQQKPVGRLGEVIAGSFGS